MRALLGLGILAVLAGALYKSWRDLQATAAPASVTGTTPGTSGPATAIGDYLFGPRGGGGGTGRGENAPGGPQPFRGTVPVCGLVRVGAGTIRVCDDMWVEIPRSHPPLLDATAYVCPACQPALPNPHPTSLPPPRRPTKSGGF